MSNQKHLFSKVCEESPVSYERGGWQLTPAMEGRWDQRLLANPYSHRGAGISVPRNVKSFSLPTESRPQRVISCSNCLLILQDCSPPSLGLQGDGFEYQHSPCALMEMNTEVQRYVYTTSQEWGCDWDLRGTLPWRSLTGGELSLHRARCILLVS